jgi:hypothetical protein
MRRQLNIARIAQRNEDLNFGARQKSTVYADSFESHFSSPTQAAVGF